MDCYRSNQRDTTHVGTSSGTTHSTDPVVLSGWLTKQGSKVKTWKRRFFRLYNQELTYQVAPDDVVKGYGLVTHVDIWTGEENGLVIELNKRREMYVFTDSIASQRQWYEILQYVTTQKTISLPAHRYDDHLGDSLRQSRRTGRQPEGWLSKKRPVLGSFKPYYFSLSGQVLSYRSNEHPLATIKGSGRLAKVEYWPSQRHGLKITIDLTTPKVLLVHAESREDQNRWFESLQAALKGEANDSRFSESMQSGNSLMSQSSLSVDSDRPTIYESDVPRFTGWLTKQGQNIKTWKRRYFQLTGITLAYYISEDSGKPQFSDDVISVELWKKKPNGLMIQFDNGRVLYTYADTSESARSWYSAIGNALMLPEYQTSNQSPADRLTALEPEVIHAGWLTSAFRHRNANVTKRFYYELLEHSVLVMTNDGGNNAAVIKRPLGQIESVIILNHSSFQLTFTDGKCLNYIADTEKQLQQWHDAIQSSIGYSRYSV